MRKAAENGTLNTDKFRESAAGNAGRQIFQAAGLVLHFGLSALGGYVGYRWDEVRTQRLIQAGEMSPDDVPPYSGTVATLMGVFMPGMTLGQATLGFRGLTKSSWPRRNIHNRGNEQSVGTVWEPRWPPEANLNSIEMPY